MFHLFTFALLLYDLFGTIHIYARNRIETEKFREKRQIKR